MAPPVSLSVVPIVRPALDEAEAQAAANVVRSGWLMQGQQVQRFEQALGAYLTDDDGAPHVVAVVNGTAALELALRAVGVGPGDEVITVSHSFIATANSVLAVGATPVFVDVHADTLGMDPTQAERALSPKTKAILCVHQLGYACDLEGLMAVAAQAGVALIEDAACALGTEIHIANRWRKIGRPQGDVACFSFHPRKVITTGEGGAVVTNNDAWATRLRGLRQHAIPAMAPRADPDLPDGYAYPAYNARMTDICAAIGLIQLAKLPSLLSERRAQAMTLHAQLRDNKILAPAPTPDLQRPNWQSYPARLRATSPLTAADVLAFLKNQGISARGGLTNAHQEPAYTSNSTGWRAAALTMSERLRREVIMLPLFPGLAPGEKAQLQDALKALDSTNGSP